MKPLTGNLNKDSKARDGWFLGHFMEPGSGFHSDDVEVKWGAHQKGWKKAGHRDDTSKTLNILVKGAFRLDFTDTKEKILLSKEGDFVLFDTKPHIGEALKDTVIITVRWPSKQ